MNYPMAKALFAGVLLVGSRSVLADYWPSDPDTNVFEIPDPLHPGQFLSRQWGLERMNVQEAWNFTRGSPNVKIGVIDTGIVEGTPDLAGQYLPPQNSVGTPFEGSASDAHGTWVASVIDMDMNNGIGGAGVGSFPIQPIRATSYNGATSTTSDTWIINAIQMAAQDGCRVMTISLGALSYGSINAAVTAQLAANKAAGKPDFLVFMAAGNSNIASVTGDTSLDNAASRLPSDNIIMVAGTNEADRPWEQSYNPANPSTVGTANGPFIDLAAPAQDIWVANGTANDPPNNPAYGYLNGTSFASPYAASAAAMVWAVNPSLTAVQVENILFDTAYNPDRPLGAVGAYWDSTFGWGRVDIGAAVTDAAFLPGSTVPEPGSLILLGAGCVALLRRRRGRGR